MRSWERSTDGDGRRYVEQPWPDRWPDLGGEAGGRDVVVHHVEHPVHLFVGGGCLVGEIGPEPCSGSFHPVEAADQPDSVALQSHQVEIPRVTLRSVADQLHRRLAAGSRRVGDLVDGAGEPAGDVQPPEDVHASIPAWHPGVSTDRENHLAPRAIDLVGDLHARGRGADYEHATWRELSRVAVAVGSEHLGCVQAGGQVRHTVRAGRDDHLARMPCAAVGDDPISPGRMPG